VLFAQSPSGDFVSVFTKALISSNSSTARSTLRTLQCIRRANVERDGKQTPSLLAYRCNTQYSLTAVGEMGASITHSGTVENLLSPSTRLPTFGHSVGARM
jgi:hypothetical protein